jgi:VCBS repeat-containing protein
MSSQRNRTPLLRRMFHVAGVTSMAAMISFTAATPVQAAPFASGGFEPPGVPAAPVNGFTTYAPGASLGSSGWVVPGDSMTSHEVVHTDRISCFEGVQCLFLRGVAGVIVSTQGGKVSQTFDTVPGATYQFRFNAAANPLGPNASSIFSTFLTDTPGLQNQVVANSGNPDNPGWLETVYPATPKNSGSNTQMSLVFVANDATCSEQCGVMLDNVRIFENLPPSVAQDSYDATEDTPLVVPAAGVLANDSDPESAPLTAALVSQPANGTVSMNADGGFTYTPNPNFNGEDTFTYAADDGEGTTPSEESVTITVAPVNDPPTIPTDDPNNPGSPNPALNYVAESGQPLPIAPPGVLEGATDVDGDALTAMLQSGPEHGGLELNSDGSFIYTSEAGFVGTDTFTFTASDGTTESAPATVTIQVVPLPNNAPVASDDEESYTTTEGTPLTVPAPGVLANDTDVDGDALTAVLQSTTAHGSLVLNADGSFTYTPEDGFVGADSFTYVADDGQGVGTAAKATSEPATVTITVTAAAASGGGGGLPVTGSSASVALAVGVATTTAGLATVLIALVVARRRRHRVTVQG